MNVDEMEFLEGLNDGRLIAGVQPFGTQLQLLFAPGRTESSHCLGIHAQLGLSDRVDIPRQLARIVAPTWTGYRWVDQHQALQARRTECSGANGKARAHRVAHKVILLQPQCLSEGDDIERTGIGVVSQIRATGRQTAAANIKDIGVEILAQHLANKAPGDRWAGDAWY
ncbi:hypothetical protein D3C77_483290 [compost metagenome]